MEGSAITWRGYWGDGDQNDPDIPEPWETFTLMAHGHEAGDYREATVDDLRRAGFVSQADYASLTTCMERAEAVVDVARNYAVDDGVLSDAIAAYDALRAGDGTEGEGE